MSTVLPWIFLAPLAGLAVTALGAPRRAGLASLPGPLLILLAGLFSLVTGAHDIVVELPGAVPVLADGAFKLRVDALASVMLVVVGAVGTCVYLYSLAYMADDVDVRRFFCFLDLFLVAMCLLVLAGNVLVLLCGWTGVGVMSFLLISFWWRQDGTLRAGALAVGANAIGDAALLLIAVLVPRGTELVTLHTAEVTQAVPGGALTLGALLVVAAAAKSAQGPLFFWLPSAMAGPTPVSALIHAATMVAAGVYLLVRTHGVVLADENVAFAVALVGTVTTLGGGVASLWQRGLKRGLAYSTVSQLGYMFAAVGVGVPFAALFHLITHASFKALLFLTAGVVLHSTGHDDLASLGGLKKKLPSVRLAFVVGGMALIGVPLVSAGGFSKDAILVAALERQPSLGVALVAGVLLTGLYIGRLYFLTFEGPEREASAHVHAPSPLLLWPMLPLGIGALALGYLEAGTGALSGVLGGEVPALTEGLHVVPDALGVGAAVLGAVGFFAGRYVTLPVPPALFTDGLNAALAAPTVVVTRFANGSLGRYTRFTLAGVAALALLGSLLLLGGLR